MALAPTGRHGWRAITAVIALYAFVLQGVLGAATAAGPAPGGAALCLPDGDDRPAGERGAPHAHSAACMAAHAVAAGMPPRARYGLVAWAMRRVAPAAYARDRTDGPPAPPHALARARDPPAA